AGSRVLVLGDELAPKRRADVPEDLIERDGAPGPDVEHHPSGCWDHRREYVNVGDVADIDEVARLLAIAVDDWCTALQRGCDEGGDDGRIGAMRILGGAEDVEVAQGDGLDAIECVPDRDIGLRRELLNTIRREWARGEVFGCGRGGGVAVAGR